MFKTVVKAIRVHQWVKNLLLFIPLIMSHHAITIDVLIQLGYAFLAFSFCASSVYLINDIVDLPHDRQHPTKCNRPLAAGKLSLSHAWLLVGFLLCGAALLASLLPIRFAYVLLVYLVLTALYSFWLKKIMVLDVLLLASFYAIRILGGGDAIAVPVSEWLLMFSMFIFVSLGCVKRFSELYGSRERGLLGASGRGYVVTDIEQLAYFGTSAGYLSVLVFALYINSDEVTRLYTQPQILWLICPLLLYWISRVWILTHRGAIHEDPIVFALHDKVSYFVGIVTAMLLGVAHFA